MTMFRSVVVCCGVLAAVSGLTDAGPVSQCVANPGPVPLASRVAGCDRAPCALPQREDAVIDIALRAPRDSLALTTAVAVYLTISGSVIPIPYDLGEKSATCKYLLSSSCPVREGEIILYTLRLFVDHMLPVDLKTVVEVRILDDVDAVTCLRLPFKVEPPRISDSHLGH